MTPYAETNSLEAYCWNRAVGAFEEAEDCRKGGLDALETVLLGWSWYWLLYGEAMAGFEDKHTQGWRTAC